MRSESSSINGETVEEFGPNVTPKAHAPVSDTLTVTYGEPMVVVVVVVVESV